MNRRDFITLLGAAATSLGLAADLRGESGRVYRIGVLETIPAAQNAANLAGLLRGLRERGYVEGQNLQIQYRSADGRAERFPDLAAAMVRLPVDLIVTRGTPAAKAAKGATETVPIVMAAIAEPLGVGVVASLAHPGGNVTGLSAFVTELAGKRVELLKAAHPSIARVGLLQNMGNPASPPQWEATRAAAAALGLAAEMLDVRTAEDIAGAFAAIASLKLDALSVGIDALTQSKAETIVGLAAEHKLLTAYPAREFVEMGGLMSYGPSYPDLYYRAAGLIDKIFKGAKPGDLPVEQPTKLELVINLNTAKALGLTIPHSMLMLADEVIECELMLLLGGAMTAARTLHAQQKAMPVIGFLSPTSPGPFAGFVAAFHQGLSETGYVEGQNVAIEYRWAEGRYDRLPALAADLVARKVDVIVAPGSPLSLAAKNATSTIPIIFMGGDPVAEGLVDSFARPGGNLTGVTFMNAELMPKRLELLSELAPQASVIALLVNPNNSNVDPTIRDVQEAARAKGVQLRVLRASTESEIDAAFATLVQVQAGALVLGADPFFGQRRDQLVALAARHGVPAIADWRGFPAAGGLISYGTSFTDSVRQVGMYAGKILKGTKPADLPVQQPTRFELVVNLKTAQALGLTVPQMILARATEVIE